MLWNALLLALRAIRRNLMRSFLTTLGIVIGVAAVITMVTLGNGATSYVGDQIASMGTNQLTIARGQHSGAGSDAPSFRDDDVQAIREHISAVDRVAPIVRRSITAVHQERNWSTVVQGTTNDYFEIANWDFVAGRRFTDGEQRAGRAVCIIGETVRERLFGRQTPLGRDIRIGVFVCEVIGLLKPKGQAPMGADQDDVIVMPMRTVQRRLLGTQDIWRIVVSARASTSTDVATRQLTSLLRERRGVAENEEDNFRILDMRQIAETLNSTIRVLTSLLGAVAAVSLLVGGIGIMNIMLVSVTERTREIGIRLAIGAQKRDVLLQFLIEAVVLSGLGGALGVALATAASIGLCEVMRLPYVFDPTINLLAFLVSAAIGVVFGYFPARRAASMIPIDALRHE